MNNKNNNLKNLNELNDLDLSKKFCNTKNRAVKNEILLHLNNKYKNLIYSTYKKYSFLKEYYTFDDYRQDAFLILYNTIQYYKKGNNEKYSFGILYKWLLNNHCKRIFNQEFSQQPDELSEFEPSKLNFENEIILNETVHNLFYYRKDFSKIKNILQDLKHYNKNQICKMYNVNYYYLNNILYILKNT